MRIRIVVASHPGEGFMTKGWVNLIGCLAIALLFACGGTKDIEPDPVEPCDTGFERIDGLCVDIDECATDNGACGDALFWTCTNNEGADPNCTDIDECAEDNGDCGNAEFWICTNNEGAAATCTDIDECAVNNGECGDPLFWICQNIEGSEPYCEDVDECAVDNGGCGDPETVQCEDRKGGPPRCIFDWVPDWTILTAGVEKIEYGGALSSSLIVHGRLAFPVVMDPNGRTSIAAARVEHGRILHVGHESQIGGAITGSGDIIQLLLNAFSWMGGSNPVVGHSPGMPALATFLSEQGIESMEVGPSDLGDVDIYIRTIYESLSDEENAIVQEFVRNGGGLILGGHAWYWAYSNENPAEEHPGNKTIWGMGITISGNATLGDTHLVGPDPPTKLNHATYALDALLDHKSGDVLLDAAQIAVAANTVTYAVQSLPLSFSEYYDAIKLFIQAAGSVIPRSNEPLIPAEQPVEFLIAAIQNKFALELPASLVEAHAASSDFPGGLPEDAESVSKTLTINASYEGRSSAYAYSNPGSPVWRSTGLYAAAGEMIMVTIPDEAMGKELQVLIGCHTDGLWEKDSIERFPTVHRSYKLNGTTTLATSAFGGLVYITVPPDTDLGMIEVIFEGTYEAPLYVHGETLEAEWNETIRNFPGPWAEFASDKLVITIPSADAQTIDYPAALMTFWDAILDAMADLEGSPHDRVRPERFVMDRQISLGWMHSGYPLMGHVTGVMDLIDIVTIQDNGSWGPFHELGHNHQYMPWILPGTTETTCNLWSVYISEHHLGLDLGTGHEALNTETRAQRMADYLATGPDFSQWSVWTALETYLQLKEAFGWEIYQTLFPEYRGLDPTEIPADNTARINEWVRRSAWAVGKDLGPFYVSWGFPVDQWVLDEIAALPPWLENPMWVSP
jgi:hypothetical protein